ncbi:hypothetical protein AB0D12_32925 [Streptomyces sp. NPDC048479]|uniref:hypothetical protein n=1 Tax=Streptomyces sp. NPDC048479 TaxID=3154725 RepID=UPI00342B1BBD
MRYQRFPACVSSRSERLRRAVRSLAFLTPAYARPRPCRRARLGAVFDAPDRLVACIVGDGEAETGPLPGIASVEEALEWQTLGLGSTFTDMRRILISATHPERHSCERGHLGL